MTIFEWIIPALWLLFIVCPLLRVERKRSATRQTGAFDPQETFDEPPAVLMRLILLGRLARVSVRSCTKAQT
jgi:hypothetical protein